MSSTLWARLLAATLLLSAWPAAAHGHQDSCGPAHDDRDGKELRELAGKRVEWRDHKRKAKDPIAVQILGFNDFHGQMLERRVANRPAGGAAVLASYLRDAMKGKEDSTLIIHAGDHVGATPPESALLQDEPAIMVLNTLANEHCAYRPLRKKWRWQYEREDAWDEEEDCWDHEDYGRRDLRKARCNVVGTLGNHEFDEGRGELLRLIDGGNHATGPFLQDPWRGSRFPYVNSNVIDSETGRNLLPPFVVRRVGGARVGVIGAVLTQTPTIVTPTGVAGLTFLDEAESINEQVGKLQRDGVHAIVVTIHQGASQASYVGDTDPARPGPSGVILGIIQNLDDDVDVVISGHTHQFSNALVKNRNGKEILVVQAFSASTAFDWVQLEIDRRTGDVVSKSARVVTTWGDEGPGLLPDLEVKNIVDLASAAVAPLVSQVVGESSVALTRAENAAGESVMGTLIADAQLAAMGTDFAFMNPGGIRNDLPAGPITWGQLFSVQPFGNTLVKLELTGQDIYDLLEQQWLNQPFPRIMKIAGLGYTWDPAAPVGARIVEVHAADGTPLDPVATYTVTCNNFMAAGGDNYTVFTRSATQVGGPVDLDALISYLAGLAQPFSVEIQGRIQLAD